MKKVLLLLFVLSDLAMAGGEPAPKKPADGFKITTRRKSDAVEVEANKERTVFVVKSPSGISQATIERLEEGWPGVVVLRLHLKGMEAFRASNGKVTLEAAVSSQGKTPKARLWKDGQEAPPLDEKSPFWMAIRIVGDGDGRYFEMTLPKAFLEGNPKSITLMWVDFHRG